MAEELEEQEVLLASEKDSDELKVVSGVDSNGQLETVDANKQNQADFFKFNKYGNALDNFLTNYFSQVKNPKHTGLYRAALNGIEDTAKVFKELLKSGAEGEEFTAKYKVDTSKYEFNQNSQQTKEYQPYDQSKIDWEMFEKIGITKESLEKTADLEKMLNYRRSSELYPITMNIDGLSVNTDARLSLRLSDDKRLIPVIHSVRKEPPLDKPFYGNSFTAEDKENLLKKGNLGRLMEIKVKGEEQKINVFVSVDDKTNDLIAYNAKNVKVPDQIKGVELDDNQKQQLAQGKSIYLEGMTSKTGKQFNAHIQFNAQHRGFAFKFDEIAQKQAQQNSQQGVRIPTKLGGVEIPKEDQEKLKAGDVIHVDGMIDRKGEKYSAYVKVNKEKGKLDFYKWDPRQENKVSPDNKSKTQVAVNSEGKSDEATKHQTEPLKNQQDQQDTQRSKGMKR